MINGKVGKLLFAAATMIVATMIMAAVLLGTPILLRAQTPAVTSYSATVVNRSKGEIYFKIVGGKGKAFLEGTLAPNYKLTQAVSGGDKVVCIWNSDGYLLAAWRLTVVGDCTISVPDLDSSKQPNFSEPGEGIVEMQRETFGSQAPSPAVEKRPN